MTAAIAGVHPYADQYPMLPDSELDELADSISQYGQLHPIIVTPDGLVLDGRNRWEACKRIGADVTAVETDLPDSEWADFVIASNTTRRHMKPGARAMAAALVFESAGKIIDGRLRHGEGDFADLQNASSFRSQVSRSIAVLTFARDLAAQVRDGKVSLNEAFTKADGIRKSAEGAKAAERERKKREREEAKAEAERNAKIVGDLTEAEAIKYLALIESGDMTPAAAWAAHREETRKERERAEAERKARSDLYSGIARGLQIVGGYGKYESYDDLMAEYDPAELNPTQYVREFDMDNLRAAARFIDWLISWRQK